MVLQTLWPNIHCNKNVHIILPTLRLYIHQTCIWFCKLYGRTYTVIKRCIWFCQLYDRTYTVIKKYIWFTPTLWPCVHRNKKNIYIWFTPTLCPCVNRNKTKKNIYIYGSRQLYGRAYTAINENIYMVHANSMAVRTPQ